MEKSKSLTRSAASLALVGNPKVEAKVKAASAEFNSVEGRKDTSAFLLDVMNVEGAKEDTGPKSNAVEKSDLSNIFVVGEVATLACRGRKRRFPFLFWKFVS